MPRMKWSSVGGSKYIEPAIADKLVTSRQEAKGDRIKTHLQGELKLQNQSLVRKADVIHPSAGKLPKCVLVEGAPGMGKTTFVWKLCREWSEGILYQVYRLVVLLRMQDRRVQTADTLYDIFYHDNKAFREIVVEKITRCGGAGVLLILDGIDEFPHLLYKPLFGNLLDGISLPEAALLITVRPSGTLTIFDCLGPESTISRHFELLGFTNEGIEQYYRSAFPSLEQLHDFLDYLSINPCIREMMHVPLNIAIVIEVYKSRKYAPETSTPQTLTELYTSLCCTLLHRYMTKNSLRRRGVTKFTDLPPSVHCDFMSICEKAFEMLDTQEPDTHYSPDPEKVFNHLGFMNSFTEVRPDGFSVSYHFQHSTVQKYLAAVYISTLPPERQTHLLRVNHLECHFDYVWRFFAGLTQFKTIGWHAMKEICFESEEDGAQNGTQEEESPLEQSPVLDISMSGLHWLYELHSKVDTFELLDGVVCRFRSTISLSPFDCLALGTCISYSNCKWELVLSGDISKKAIKMFGMALTAPRSSPGCVEKLDISIGQLGSHVYIDKLDICIGQLSVVLLTSFPVSCYHTVTELRLRRSGLDPTGFPDLTARLVEVLDEMTELTVLDLSYNRFGSGGAEAVVLKLLVALSLQELYLCDTEIGLVDIKALCLLLNSPLSSLEKLDLSENTLTPECLLLLSHTLEDRCTVTELDLSFSHFDHNSMNSLASMLQRDNVLKVLSLRNCDIDDLSASYLVGALSENNVIENIYLSGNPCVESVHKLTSVRAVTVDL